MVQYDTECTEWYSKYRVYDTEWYHVPFCIVFTVPFCIILYHSVQKQASLTAKPHYAKGLVQYDMERLIHTDGTE